MSRPWCELCGEAADQPVHARCTLHAELEPPRYCGQCRRRMTVQITPAGWSARCVEHGTRTAAAPLPDA